MTTRNTLLLFCTLALSCISLHAQVGLQISRYKPSGDYGFLFQPSNTYSVVTDFADEGSGVRVGLSFSFTTLKTWENSVPVVTVDGTALLFAENIYNRYSVPKIGFFYDHAIASRSKDWPVYPTLGGSLLMVGILYDIDTKSQFVNSSSTGLTLGAEFVLKVGGYAPLMEDKIGLWFGMGRGRGIMQAPVTDERMDYWVWKPYLSVMYYWTR